jgi:pimeloyl-ACP methyl ester carboxylesterase
VKETTLSENVKLLCAQTPGAAPWAVIAFGGIAQGLGMPVFEFFKTLDALGIDALFVRDPTQSWYQHRIEGLGDGPEAMAAALTTLLERHLPRRRILAIGNSMGGWAAMLFGCLCRFDAALAISPQTFISPSLRREHSDFRWATQIGSIRNPCVEDLRPLLQGSCCPKVSIYVGESDRFDRIHAARLEDIPQVQVHVLEHCGHDAATCLRDRGMLLPILKGAVDC